MNIYDISEKAGVSIATVSRVINGSPKVSEKTKEKVNKVIKETGYTPSMLGQNRNNSAKQTKTIGILCTSLTQIRISNIVEYLNKKLFFLGYETILCCCGTILQDKRNAFAHFTSKKIDAILIIGIDFMEYKQEYNQYLLQSPYKKPILLLNASIEGTNIWSILCDEKKAIYTLTENMLKHNRNKLLFLFSSMSSTSISKLDAFKNANSVHNVTVPPEYIQLCKSDNKSSYAYVDKLLSENKPIQGIICSDDLLANGVIKAISDHNLSIPDDIEVSGSGFTIFSEISTPTITTINCRDEEVCKSAINTMIAIFNGSNTATRTIITAEIVKNKSTDL